MRTAHGVFFWVLLAATAGFPEASLAAAPEYFSTANLVPPINSVYITPAQFHVLYANGIIIRDVRHRGFTENLPLPPLRTTEIHTFGSTVALDLSTDGGKTFHPVTTSANVAVRLTHTQDDAGGTSVFDTEMLQLDLAGGGLPQGLMVRESPTKASSGQTTIRAVPGGYMIGSFFDIFTEVSLDGGASWGPSELPAHVELRIDPESVSAVPEPTPLLPPPNDHYVSAAQWHALYAQGIVIKDVRHKLFTGSLPPPTTNQTHRLSSQLDLQISTDGGTNFQYVRASAPIQILVTHAGSVASGFFDTEMLGLDLTLPGNVMIRESPTLPSRGATELTPQSDGSYRVSSFFDIFTEVSLDGGQTWSAALNGPVRVQLTPLAPEVPEPTPNLPPLESQYISPSQWHALYANGIIISNVSHSKFSQTQPPPPSGNTSSETFLSTVDLQMSMDGGKTFSPASAQAGVGVRISSRADLDTGGTRFFDTEMLQLMLQGGSLPPGVMVRESPTRASLGRTSLRQGAAGGLFRISSFFDVFTEITLDGGQTWSPSTTGPGTMVLNGPLPSPLVMLCPPDINVTASGPGGAVVFYTVTASGGCNPPPTVVANPPSGSTFPVGTTTVTAMATDGCGNKVSCTFTVTVNPRVVEVDTFKNTVAEITLQLPSGATETVTLSGPTTVHVFIAPDGAASDTDGNGLDDVATEMVQLDLSGNSSLGPVAVHLDPTQPSLGQIEEQVNNTPGTLDVAPFTATGNAHSFFDVFLLLQVAGQTFHPATPVHMAAVITHKPPAPGDTYVNPFTQPVDLLNADGKPTGIKVLREVHTPNPPVEVDTFPATLAEITLQLPNGGSEAVALAGPTTVHVFIAPNGAASDSDGNGLDDVVSEMVQLDLSGTSSLGPVSVHLAANPPSLGRIEEQANHTPGTLDVAPFTASGSAHSFFDVFLEIQVGDRTLHPATPVHMAAVITHKPPAPGDTYVNPFTQPVDLLDANGNPTGIKVLKEVHTPNPAPLTIRCSSNIVVTATSAAGAVVTYTVTASGGCSPPPTVVANPPSGSTFPVGTTTVTAMATDGCGNKVSCTFTVTVNPRVVEVDTFKNTVAEITLQLPSGATETVTLSGPTTVHVFIGLDGAASDTDGNGLDDVATEMVQLDLSGNSSLGPVAVHLDPTQASLGQIEEQANNTPGTLDVAPFTATGNAHSFFDVFLLLQVAGQTFHPATPVHMAAVITHKPPAPGDTYVNPFTQPVDLLNADGKPTGIKVLREVHTPNPPVEVDTFPATLAEITLQLPNGGSEAVALAGPTTVHVFIAPNGAASDSDGNGLDDVVSEMVQLDLSGTSSLGPVSVHLAANPPSLGRIEEQANDTPGTLDVAPFTASGSAHSFFDVFLEIQVGDRTLHPATPVHMAAVITHKPPAPGDTYVNPFTQPVDLLDANGNPTGIKVLKEVHTPNPAPLTIRCSSNIVVTATSAAGAVVTYTVTASGGCSPPPTVVANPPSGSTFPVGTTTVTAMATDGCGNKVSCTFTVTVNPRVVEVDTFKNTVAEITLQLPSGATETVTLSGPTTVHVFIAPDGAASDTDGNGLDDVATEMVQLDLSGNSSLGPVAVHLDPTQASLGQIEEQANNTPGTLDVAPFTATGNAHSFFDVFLLLQVAGQTFHPATPVHMAAVITHKPPAPGDTYVNPFTQPVDLLNADGKPTGIKVLREVHTPNPPVEVDTFPATLAEITLQLPNGGSEAVALAGPTTVHVFIAPNGAASDSDGNGLDDVVSEMVQLDLSGTSSLGPVSVHLAANPPSLGRIEEQANDTPGTLDVAPFTASGSAHSFFDVFLEIQVGDRTLHPATPVHMAAVITHKPPAPGDTYVNPFTQPVDLLDANGNPTGIKVLKEVHTPNPAPLTIRCSSNIVVTATSAAGAVVTYTVTASGGCNPPPTVVANPPSGSTFPVGTTTVTAMATDGCGNKVSCTFTVTVNPRVVEVDTFKNTVAEITLQLPSGATETVTLSGPTTVHVFIAPNGAASDTDGNGLDDVPTEMVQLDLSGNSSLGPVAVHLDPTQPSLGQIEEQANNTPGTLDVAPFTATGNANSFFDVFLLLQVAGQTFHPATPVHMAAVITHKPPAPGDTYVNPFTQPVDLLNADGKPTGIKVLREVHTPNPPVEVDTFPATLAEITLQLPNGGSEAVALAGPTTVHVFIAPNGAASDSDGNGLDDVVSEMVQLDLSGTSSLGPVSVHLAANPPSLGRIEEQANDTPGTLDVAPFTASGSAHSFFDVFLEIQVGDRTLHPATPVHMAAVITHKPPAPGDTYVNPFTQPVDLLDANGNPTGIKVLKEVHTPNPAPLTIRCSSNIVVTATSAAGAVVTYTVTASGGCNPPPTVVANPPSGSTFPVGTTTVTAMATDGCGNKVSCTFTVTVLRKQRFFPVPLLPPTNGYYISPQEWHALYAQGIIVSNVIHRRFTPTFQPPPPGTSETHRFGSEVDLDLSRDDGRTFQPVIVKADVVVSVRNVGNQGTEQVYETEMMELDLFGGTLPPQMLLRESPTLASMGETRITPSLGGYMISSFFDVFTELSLDGGATWSASDTPGHMELHIDPGTYPTSIMQPRIAGNQPSFVLQTQIGLRYRVQYKVDLNAPDWTTLTVVSGDGQQITVNDTFPTGVLHRFYRLLIEEDPNR